MNTAYRLFKVGSFIAFVLSGFIACDNNGGPGPEPPPNPEKPVLSEPDPPDGANGVDLFLKEVGWKCSNPNNESLTYDVYFGKDTASERIGEGLTETKCALPVLDKSTKYLWQVCVHYGGGLLELGPVWSFTTSGDEGCSWHFETVSAESCRSNCIRVDTQGNPRVAFIAYSGGYTSTVKFARRENGNWILEVVDGSLDLHWDTILALDTQGNPHISYIEGLNPDQKLKYAYRTGGSWKTETIDDNLGTSSGIRLATIIVDGAGVPHVSYNFAQTYSSLLRYAHRVNGTWVKENVFTESIYAPWTSIAVDSNNYPYIFYTDYNYAPYQNKLEIAYKKSGSWQKETIASGSTWLGYGNRDWLIIDDADRLHIYYPDVSTTDEAMYGRKVGSNWVLEKIGGHPGTGHKDGGLGVDSFGWPHTVFNDNELGLIYAHKTGGGWSLEIVDNDTGTVFSSIAVDADRRPRISYYDMSGSGGLIYAWFGPGSSSSKQKQRESRFNGPSRPDARAAREKPAPDEAVKRRFAEADKKSLVDKP